MLAERAMVFVKARKNMFPAIFLSECNMADGELVTVPATGQIDAIMLVKHQWKMVDFEGCSLLVSKMKSKPD